MSADIDPSLCAAEPAPDTLADGFSPLPETVPHPPEVPRQEPPTELGAKSPF